MGVTLRVTLRGRGATLGVAGVIQGVTFAGLAWLFTRNQAADRHVPRGGEANARGAAAKPIGALAAHLRRGRGVSNAARGEEFVEEGNHPRGGPAIAAGAEERRAGEVRRRLIHRPA